MSLQYNPFSKSSKTSRLSYASKPAVKKPKRKTPLADDNDTTVKHKKSKKTPVEYEENNPFFVSKEPVSADPESSSESDNDSNDVDTDIQLKFQDSEDQNAEENVNESLPTTSTEDTINTDNTINNDMNSGIAKDVEIIINTPNAATSKDEDEKPKRKSIHKEDNPFLAKEKKVRSPRPDREEKRHHKSRSPAPQDVKEVKDIANAIPKPVASPDIEAVPKINPFINKEPAVVEEEPVISVNQLLQERVDSFIQNCPVPPNTLIPSITYTSLPLPPREDCVANDYMDPKIFSYIHYLYQNRAYLSILSITSPLLVSLKPADAKDPKIYFNIFLYHIYSLLAMDDISSVIDIYNNDSLYSSLFTTRDPLYIENMSFEFKVLVACFPAYANDISMSLQRLYSLYLAISSPETTSNQTLKKLYSRSRSSSMIVIEQNKSNIKDMSSEQTEKYKFLIEKEIVGLLIKQKKYTTALTFIDENLLVYIQKEAIVYIKYMLEMAIKVCVNINDIDKCLSYIDQYKQYSEDKDIITYYSLLSQMRAGQYYQSFCQLQLLINDLSDDDIKLSCANNLCICSLHCGQVEQTITLLESLILENPYLFVNRTLFKNLTYMYDLILTPDESNLRKLMYKQIFKEYEIEYINDSDLKITP